MLTLAVRTSLVPSGTIIKKDYLGARAADMVLSSLHAVGITGTPCTGKKTIAPFVASLLGMTVVDLNSFGSTPRKRRSKERAVDTGLLRRHLLRRGFGDAVVSGHLLPEVLKRGDLDFVVVLRCNPLVLKERLIARRYSDAKVLENVEAELIGVVLDASVRAFGEDLVHEYDTTSSTPSAVARRIARDYRSRRSGRQPWTDWTLDYDSSTKLRLLLRSAAERTGPAST